MALGEVCCFYTNYSGVIRDSMTVLRKRLHDRKLKRQQNEGWYESLFNWSPWLSTLLSALAGPLVFLLLALTCGPCRVNALVRFVKDRISTIQLMALRQQYRPIDLEELSLIFEKTLLKGGVRWPVAVAAAEHMSRGRAGPRI